MENIFVGNLSFSATQQDVRKLFEKFGTVSTVIIVKGKKDKSRGFCFVNMPDEEHVLAALSGLAGKEFMGRVLKISRVRPTEKPGSRSNNFRPAPRASAGNRRSEFRPHRRDDRESKPWVKREGGSRPYRQDDRESKPWDKSKGSSAPFTKFSESKPWVKKSSGPRPYRDDSKAKPWQYKGGPKPFNRSGGPSSSKPWAKKEGEGARPHRHDDRESKPWSKNTGASKAPYKKFDGPSKSWGKDAGRSKYASKPGAPFKKFYQAGRAPKPFPKKDF